MKYIWAIVGVFVVIILAVILLSSGGSKTATTNGDKAVKLSDYTTKPEAQVRYTTDGPINAQENHRAVRISITPTTRTVEIIRGYQNEVLNSRTYDNNTDSFNQFLDALTRANFTAERKGVSKPNENAVCPTNARYTYEIFDGTTTAMRLWSATCTGGTFGGNSALTRQLFQAQIPDYNSMTTNLNLGATAF